MRNSRLAWITWNIIWVSVFIFSACVPQGGDFPAVNSGQQTSTPAPTAEINQPVEITFPSPTQVDAPKGTRTPVSGQSGSLWWAGEQESGTAMTILRQENSFDLTIDKDGAAVWVEANPQDAARAKLIFELLFTIAAPYTQQKLSISKAELEEILTNAEYQPDLKIWTGATDFLYLERMYEKLMRERFLISKTRPDNCEDASCLRLTAFEWTEPFWRVLAIDGNTPLHEDFDVHSYPLAFRLYAAPNPRHESASEVTGIVSYTNFHPELLTTVLLTGTTALVRHTAEKIEQNGLDFPAKNILGILSGADITHISNEIPFYSNCPAAIPVRPEMRFCSDPGYVEILKRAGVDVVELTGNHLLDWGPQAFAETLTVYEKNELPVYGGGWNAAAAQKPLFLTVNNNPLVFVGCNAAGPDNNWAAADRPGTQKCDMEKLAGEISRYRMEGYLPVVTLQHYEVNDFSPSSLLRRDFKALAEAGAVIVSGSQAHFPQGIDFAGDAFIHYGLGNLFFDQMDTWLRRSTMDLHYFYQGRYLNSELIPIINEDFGQPRLMTEEEAQAFLTRIYEYSFYAYRDGQ